eukprot:327941-Hanusia_phi.AAC.4
MRGKSKSLQIPCAGMILKAEPDLEQPGHQLRSQPSGARFTALHERDQLPPRLGLVAGAERSQRVGPSPIALGIRRRRRRRTRPRRRVGAVNSSLPRQPAAICLDVAIIVCSSYGPVDEVPDGPGSQPELLVPLEPGGDVALDGPGGAFLIALVRVAVGHIADEGDVQGREVRVL